MKTVVITGSARGFGYALAEEFRKLNYNVVLTDINKEELDKAENKINEIRSNGKVLKELSDITNSKSIEHLINKTIKEFNSIDIWINNAGVNQTNTPIWETDEKVINRLIDIDLKGTIICSNLIVNQMIKQNKGQIYNVEGFGSSNEKRTGLSIYGTSKKAVTYFTEALAHECMDKKINVIVGKITPGIMITNFITRSLGDGEKIDIDEKTQKVYNVLGDYPDTIAKFMVEKIHNNKKNNVKFIWLTNKKAAFRFLTSPFNKRDFFKEK